MASLDTGGGGGHGKGGKKRSKKQSTNIDMTPMVDLGFLLITFFMLTTTLAKPKAMEINMPDKTVKEEDNTKIKESTAMTVILSEKNRIYYYFGITDPKVEATTFKEIRPILLERNKPQIDALKPLKEKLQKGEITDSLYKVEAIKIKGNKDALMVLIKADEKASYKNLVDMLDEMAICDIGKYAIMDISPAEVEMIASVPAPGQN